MKFKKFLAMAAAATMVMGMAVTAHATEGPDTTETPAAPVYESTITVDGYDAKATVKQYAAVTLDTSGNAYAWTIADWAKSFITLSQDGKSYTVTDAEGLAAAAAAATDGVTVADGATDTTVAETVPVGTYVYIGSSPDKTYSAVVVSTYDETQTYMAAKDVTASAKGATEIKTTKTSDDHFVAKGETVNFTVTTTFPNFANPSAAGNSFTVVDTPTGLTLAGTASVSIPGAATNASVAVTNGVIDLSSYIGSKNENAGKTVTITYTAEVTSDTGYSNTVNAYRGDQVLGQPGTVAGYTGSIEVTKTDENGNALKGAKFKVVKTAAAEKDDEDEKDFLAVDWESAEVEVDDNGIVTFKGLDEGTYKVVETVAPKGYSIAPDQTGIVIAEDTKNVEKEVTIQDTKLVALPATGGVGTTMFTIAGVVILVGAAGVYFASKRKNSAE